MAGVEGPCIGIDLGTTYSCVGYFQNDRGDHRERAGQPHHALLRGLHGQRAPDRGRRQGQVAMNPKNSVFDAKRLIGRKFQDSAVQSDMKLWPFTVIKGPADKPMIEVEYKAE